MPKMFDFVEREGVSLFPHQAGMGDQFYSDIAENGGKGTFTGFVFCNGGKTLAASYCMHIAKHAFDVTRFLVASPGTIIRSQWPGAALNFGLQLSQEITTKRIAQRKVDRELDGFSVTYQTISKFPEVYRGWMHGEKSCVIFDEIHHLGSQRTWGEACETAFEYADIKICLSGTPFRSDNATIPFLEYELCE